MTDGRPDRRRAIELTERLMASHGYLHGPCLSAKEMVGFPTSIWAIEFAYHGIIGHSPTADPSSIELQVSFKDDEAQFLDLWWNRSKT